MPSESNTNPSHLLSLQSPVSARYFKTTSRELKGCAVIVGVAANLHDDFAVSLLEDLLSFLRFAVGDIDLSWFHHGPSPQVIKSLGVASPSTQSWVGNNPDVCTHSLAHAALDSLLECYFHALFPSPTADDRANADSSPYYNLMDFCLPTTVFRPSTALAADLSSQLLQFSDFANVDHSCSLSSVHAASLPSSVTANISTHFLDDHVRSGPIHSGLSSSHPASTGDGPFSAESALSMLNIPCSTLGAVLYYRGAVVASSLPNCFLTSVSRFLSAFSYLDQPSNTTLQCFVHQVFVQPPAFVDVSSARIHSPDFQSRVLVVGLYGATTVACLLLPPALESSLTPVDPYRTEDLKV